MSPRARRDSGLPGIVLGPGIADQVEPGLQREWLVTNGLGGYASGTVAGVATRVYHALLVAAMRPPVERRVVVAALLEWVTVDGVRFGLHALEHDDGTIDTRGFERLSAFALEGTRPVWTFALGDVRLEKRVWMAHGANTTYVRYALAPGTAEREVGLEITPLVTWRDHHEVLPDPDHLLPPSELHVHWDGDGRREIHEWVRGLRHRAEAARGLPHRSDALGVQQLTGTLRSDRALSLVLSTERELPLPPDEALARARTRERALLTAAGSPASPVVAALTLAADAFVVRRGIRQTADDGAGRESPTILAGYPWFTDWGRDTLIALPGICLATGRHAEARAILAGFAALVEDGLLPNDFPDAADLEPGRNTVDASLWYPLAIDAYADAAGDATLVDELLPTLRQILDRHLAGTRYGIAAAADGLLRAGVPGQQLTWMDARVDGREITPRIGKPVEIQALWINALRLVGGWCAERGDPSGVTYTAVARRGVDTFRRRFWDPGVGYLADVVDGPDGDDWTLRPNQLLALSLPEPLVSTEVARSVLDVVGRRLETPMGLRTLAPEAPGYAGRFNGPPAVRDAAYHQGTVWPWLVGPYVDALLRHGGVRGRERARAVVERLAHHLPDGGLHSVSEVADGDPPHDAHGCPWQAWSVGELLRAWRLVKGE